MRYATIDIGTNTVLLLVSERPHAGASLVAVEEHATITRLGQGVDASRALAPEAIARTNACLDHYAGIVKRLGVTAIDVVGTSAMRDGGGGERVRDHVAARFGVTARTISGDEEAALTFRGALSGLTLETSRVLVFDIGGGSTEVVEGDRDTRAITFSKSYDIGSVRLTERLIRHDPPSLDECQAIAQVAASTFGNAPTADTETTVVGIAGTLTTLAAVSLGLATYDSAKVHGCTLHVAELEAVAKRLASVTVAERKKFTGLDPMRADVIVAGALVAVAFLRRAGASTVTVSDRGVRWGLAETLAEALTSPKSRFALREPIFTYIVYLGRRSEVIVVL